MPCISPIRALRSQEANPDTGKYPLIFSGKGDIKTRLVVTCGQCRHCRAEKARQWAVRCKHEADLYENNCFITLTYNKNNIPKNGSLDHRDIQLFFKKLRKNNPKAKIRYFMCGEYGNKLSRPHYHILIFNFDFKDKQVWTQYRERKTKQIIKLYRSHELEKTWNKGFSTIGEVNYNTAGYVARYLFKKITGKRADDHYKGKKPEYTAQSRGQQKGSHGIGYEWYKKWKDEVYPLDRVVIKGSPQKPPKYYDKQLELDNPELYAKIKEIRKSKAMKSKDNNDFEILKPSRSIGIGRYLEGRLSLLVRGLEDGKGAI